jgi:aryl-alcohol dehydrogenase-like predicted oxidoreductase
MEALHDLKKAGKVRYIGASAMYTWQFQKAQYVAEKNGWTKFVSMQNHLNLLNREEEREMVPFCKEENIALTPYSPLASGRLARPWSESTERSRSDEIAKRKYGAMEEADQKVVERVAELAKDKGVEMVQISLAWLMHKKPVTIPIIGSTKLAHLESAVPAVSVELTQEEIEFLEEPYIPHKVVGHN